MQNLFQITTRTKKIFTIAFLDVLLFSITLLLYFVSNIKIIYADAIHSASDLLITFSILFSILIIVRIQNQRRKIALILELILNITIIGIIFYTGIQIIINIYQKPQVYGGQIFTAITGEFLIITFIFFLSRYKTRVGKSENIPSLELDGIHTLMDMYSSIAIMVDLVASLAGIQLQKITILFIAFFIFKSAIEAITMVINQIRDKELKFDIIKITDSVKNSISKILSLLIFNVFDKSKKYLAIEKNKRFVIRFSLGLFSILFFGYLISGFYIIQEDESGILFRFKKNLAFQNSSAGIHYHFPAPFEKVIVTKTTKIHSIKIGKSYETDFTISGDENLIDLSILVNYRIDDPLKYFNTSQNIKDIMKQIAEASLSKITGMYEIDKILTSKKSEFRQKVEKDLAKKFSQFNLGVSIYNIEFEKNAPPPAIIASFNDVASAREQKVTKINEANKYTNSILPQARGEADSIIKKAEGFYEKVYNDAKGITENFKSIFREYRKNPDMARKNYYLERITKILSKAKIYVSDQSAKKNKWSIRITEEKKK